MNSFYRRLILLVALVVLISGAVIYFTVDIYTLKSFNAFQPWSILLALAALSLGMYFDGTRLSKLVNIAGVNISLYTALEVIFGNYFLALLTPGAAGGAVAQVMFLRRAGIPVGKATVIVLTRTLMSIMFLIVCMPIIFYIDPALIPWMSPTTLIGATIATVLVSVAGIWFLKTKFAVYFVLKTIRKFKINRRRRIFSIFNDVRSAVALLSTAPSAVFWVFVQSGFSLLALYAIVPILFLGLGAAVDWPIVMARMILLNLILYFAPTPGGSGVAEGGFVLLFGELLPPGTVGILAVTWRILAEYLPFGLGFYFTLQAFGRDFLAKQMR